MPDMQYRDGYEVQVHGDGSITFHARAPGQTGIGCLERMRAQERLARKKGFERQPRGHISNLHYINVTTSKTATLLDFAKVSGPGIRSMFGTQFPIAWFVINSDLDRSHMPQNWYAGGLPIIPADRFWAWYNRPGSGDVLRFNPPQVMDANGMRCLEAYLFLILNSWTWGIRPQDATRLMRDLGFNVDSGDIRKAFTGLVANGWAKESRNVPPKGGQTSFWRYCPTALTYSKARHFTPEDRDEVYRNLFAAFVPFLKVSDENLPSNRAPVRPVERTRMSVW